MTDMPGIAEIESAFPDGLEEFKKDKGQSAFATQVGGSHYKAYAIQPYEFFFKNNIPHHKAAIIRRILRYDHRTGKGIEDLWKIQHEVELLIELHGWKAMEEKEEFSHGYKHGGKEAQARIRELEAEVERLSKELTTWQIWAKGLQSPEEMDAHLMARINEMEALLHAGIDAAKGAQVLIEAWSPRESSLYNNNNYCRLMDWIGEMEVKDGKTE